MWRMYCFGSRLPVSDIALSLYNLFSWEQGIARETSNRQGPSRCKEISFRWENTRKTSSILTVPKLCLQRGMMWKNRIFQLVNDGCDRYQYTRFLLWSSGLVKIMIAQGLLERSEQMGSNEYTRSVCKTPSVGNCPARFPTSNQLWHGVSSELKKSSFDVVPWNFSTLICF